MLLPFPSCAAQRQHRLVSVLTLLAACLGLGGLQPILVQAETQITPSVSLVQQYDTNIYFAPAELLAPGTRVDDFVSSLVGTVEVQHKTKDVVASLRAGGDLNYYVYNTPFNYVGTNVAASAQLDGWVSRLLRGLRLSVSDVFRYTPQPPGFLSPQANAAVGGDPFARGVQNFRANNFSNTFSTNASYDIYKDLFVTGSYAFSLSRFGSILALTSTGATFFDTNVHTWSVGPGYRLTQAENVSLSFQQSLVSQTVSDGTSPETNFNTQELWANYTREVPDYWKVTLRGGVTLIEPASRAYGTVWITLTSNPERRTSIQLDLSRKATPSYFLVQGATISNVAQLSVSHKLTRRLTLLGSANYAYSETTPDASFKYSTISANAAVRYELTRTMIAGLSYGYQDFDNEFPGLSYAFTRHVVALSLTAHWDWKLGMFEDAIN
jgi:hypothetical protein